MNYIPDEEGSDAFLPAVIQSLEIFNIGIYLSRFCTACELTHTYLHNKHCEHNHKKKNITNWKGGKECRIGKPNNQNMLTSRTK